MAAVKHIVSHPATTDVLHHIFTTPHGPMTMGQILWTYYFSRMPFWENIAGWIGVTIFFFLFVFDKLPGVNRHAFEKIKLRRKDLNQWLDSSLYFEITICKVPISLDTLYAGI